MTLAARLGMDVAKVSLEKVVGKDVLLVERFDRYLGPSGWYRRSLVSGLTVLGLDEKWARKATYPDMLDQVRLHGLNFRKDATELFSRLVFKVLMGNTDDHARNHSFFVEGKTIRLTLAYDITPFPLRIRPIRLPPFIAYTHFLARSNCMAKTISTLHFVWDVMLKNTK